jgi:hypothetical protein
MKKVIEEILVTTNIRICSEIYCQMSVQLWDRMSSQVWTQISNEVNNRLSDSVKGRVRIEIWKQISSQKMGL